jgi:hypothetical protein
LLTERKPSIALCLLIFFGFGTSGAFAEGFPFTGRIYADHYGYTQGVLSGQIAQTSLSMWLEYDSQRDQSTKQGLGVHLVGQGDLFYRSLDYPYDSSSRAKLREGYVSYITEGTVVRAGQQIIPWGKSDGINPTDYFTAKDYTVFNPDDEVKRMGAPGISWTFTPDQGTSPFNIQAIFQAYYPQTKLLLPDQVVPNGINFTRYADSPEAFSPNSMEFGFKISYLKSNYDFSFSYFQGYTQFAEYVYDPARNAISPVNPKQTAIGGDASFTLGDYVVRVETALLMPDNGTDTNTLFGLVEPWHWDTVAGIERTIGNDFHIQVQGTVRHHLYYQDPSAYIGGSPTVNQIQQNVGRSNSLILNYQQQTNVGGTFRFGYASDTSLWTADVFLVGYFANGNDYLLRPQITYKPIDSIRLVAGADLYGGEDTRPLGALKDRSVAFFEAKYSF